MALLGSFLTVWATIVHDDGSAAAQFMILLAIPATGFAATFRAVGWARGMVAVAMMQLALGALTLTAPITATIPGEIARAIVATTVLTGFWLVSAAFFVRAARADAPQTERA
ncbi:hypothetical protein GCM10022211_22000 [Sphingomonas humi]|uniref:Uncharacterized protein n=1 Tax=Sphingomonas humi TaxID=335630 RepID=A0ABP7S8I1_9SPHN